MSTEKKCTYKQMIKERIEAWHAPDLGYARLYVQSDFYDIVPPESIRFVLNDLVEEDFLKRFDDGIYYKPKYDDFLKIWEEPLPWHIGDAIAKKNGWSLIPSGNTALNHLGLSTQVPAQIHFLTDGPNITYEKGGFVIVFKHASPRYFQNSSLFTATVIQAVKALGKGRVTKKEMQILYNRIEERDMRYQILNEIGAAPGWVGQVICDVCYRSF